MCPSTFCLKYHKVDSNFVHLYEKLDTIENTLWYLATFNTNSIFTSHSAYVATATESNGAKIDGF